MNILFFPSDAGGGFGHISRCLALALAAKRQGHTCAFVMSRSKFKENISHEFQTFTTSPQYGWQKFLPDLIKQLIEPRHERYPIFVKLSGLNYQIIRDGLINRTIVEKVINQYIQIVRSFKPDILVGDTNLLAAMLAGRMNIPIVQIVQSIYHPINGRLLWWETTVDERLIPPQASHLFNPILDKMRLDPINRAEELLKGDLYIIPSIPEIEPAPTDDKTVYVGALSRSEENRLAPSWFADIDSQYPLVYVTVGGGASHVGNKAFFLTLINAFSSEKYQVVISTGGKSHTYDLPPLPQNIRFLDWVPGKLLMTHADLIIYHGGHNSMMETITAGKPSIVIPFHSEQEGNGRRMEQAGCGMLLKSSKEDFNQVCCRWEYGNYSYLVQNRYDLTPEELISKVHAVLSSSTHHRQAQILQSKSLQYIGPEMALDLLLECLSLT